MGILSAIGSPGFVLASKLKLLKGMETKGMEHIKLWRLEATSLSAFPDEGPRQIEVFPGLRLRSPNQELLSHNVSMP